MTIQSIYDAPRKVASDNIKFLKEKLDACQNAQTFRRVRTTEISEPTTEGGPRSMRCVVESFWADAKGRLSDEQAGTKAEIRTCFYPCLPRIDMAIEEESCFPDLEDAAFETALRRVEFVLSMMNRHWQSSQARNSSGDKV